MSMQPAWVRRGAVAMTVILSLATASVADDGGLFGRKKAISPIRLAVLDQDLPLLDLNAPGEAAPLPPAALQPYLLQKPGSVQHGGVIQNLTPLPFDGSVQKFSYGDPACPPYRISYVRHRKSKSCEPPVTIVLAVPDPECGKCMVQVPVCVPVCCAAEQPLASLRSGMLGRCFATYTWRCGYKVELVFRCRGDLVVHTYGL